MNWPTSARRLASASLLSTVLLVATSCDVDDASDLGVELPGTTATSTEYRDFPVTASTVLQDSISTLKASSYLVGRVRDNALGTTTAKGYFNLKISPSAADTLPANVKGTTPNPQLDSVVLVMPFAAVYGSAASPLRVDVYPLTTRLDDQAVYNSASTAATDVAGVLGAGLTARLNGTRTVRQRNDPTSSTDTTTFKRSEPNRTVRLKLNASNSLLTTMFGLLKATTFSQSQLDATWKGLVIQPTSSFNGAVVNFSANSVSSAVFYYHYNKKVGTGTLKGTYSIPFGTLAQTVYGPNPVNAPRYFTSIVTEAAAPFNQLQGASNSARSIPSSATGDVAYMQAGTGFVTKLEIPGLAELKQQAQPQAAGGSPSIAINRAELQIPVQASSNLLFATPGNGYLYEANASNEPLKRVLFNSRVESIILKDGVSQLGVGLTSIEDDLQRGTGYYQNAANATRLALSDVNQYYGLLMTGYTQAYVYDKLSGPTPAAFLFSPTLRNSGALGLERAALDGKNIRLRVYYSKLR
ncbi:DUF4270 family protein [Hymenobacter norwichensis]|uniref:DUF4270 family protein n=1 Tax=Hymenobacter norwichensis TaxID=223903 RepID=UPI0004150552|nr:DUF4270 family protein [Hymenobacter norwichensis]